MRIALHGHGRMGQAVERVALERSHEVVAVFDRQRKADASAMNGAEVIIDFSHASAVKDSIEIAVKSGANLVIGTTGWTPSLIEVRTQCEKSGISVVHASNFSVGANVLFTLARQAARLFARFDDFDAGIEERHHSKKKDSPSGTAARISDIVVEASNGKLSPTIASSRVGREYGLHTLFFDSPDDLVEISHRARSREGFARGAVLAAELLTSHEKGFYSFEELLSLE